MAQRITILLDDDLAVKLRNKQARKLKESNKFVSFSQVINDVLAESLKKG